MRGHWRQLSAALALTLGLLIVTTGPAAACGGLVAPNGAIRLDRATTLVAWHGGVEQYMTSFTYEGDVSNLGWIVPLPTVPDKIQEGGAWTLQRLLREAQPPAPQVFDAAGAASTAASATVVETAQVEALNISVLRGDGQGVINWATSNGFAMSAGVSAHILAYALGSPIFMAVKYDTSRAQQRHQLTGDGSPVLITMHTAHIWVPLEVLALDNQPVNADLFFLTDTPIYASDLDAVAGHSSVGETIPTAPGFVVKFQEPMNPSLYHDLSTDRNMGWVRPDGYFTYLALNSTESQVNYDLGIGADGVVRLAPFGTAPMAVVDNAVKHAPPGWVPRLPLGASNLLWLILAALIGVALVVALRRWLLGSAKPAVAAPPLPVISVNDDPAP